MIFHFGRSPSVFSQPTRSETTPPPPLISQQKASLPISLKGSRSTAQRRGDLLMFGPTLWVTVWSGFFFFFHLFVAAVGGRLPRLSGSRSGYLHTCVETGKRRDSPAEICSRGFGLSAAAALRIALSANAMNLGPGATWDTRAEDERSIFAFSGVFYEPSTPFLLFAFHNAL